MPIDSHLPQADPFSLVPTFKYTINTSVSDPYCIHWIRIWIQVFCWIRIPDMSCCWIRIQPIAEYGTNPYLNPYQDLTKFEKIIIGNFFKSKPVIYAFFNPLQRTFTLQTLNFLFFSNFWGANFGLHGSGIRTGNPDPLTQLNPTRIRNTA